MDRYIFYTTEGHTQAPNDEEIENCQVLGIACGENRKEAEKNLLNNNPWILTSGFSPTEFLSKKLVL